MRARASGRVVVENDRVVVTEWRIAPGAETGWHVHGRDYVVVYLTDAEHTVETAHGTARVSMQRGCSYFRERGVSHNVVNSGEAEIVLVETELQPAADRG